jgi:centractin
MKVNGHCTYMPYHIFALIWACVAGFAMPHAVTRLDIAGRDITQQLLHHLRRSGHALHTSADFQIVRAIKEKLCYVSTNPAADEAASPPAVEYTLPDGNKIVLGAEVFRAPEVLFQPKLLGMEFPGLHEALGASALKAESDIRATLLANIVLAGGSTAFKGFGNRLLSELKKITPPETKIKIWAPAERKILAWVGGSILSSLGTFRSMCITKERWEDEGARVMLSTGI